VDRPWTRSSNGSLLGVCRGLADRFNVDVMMVRILFVLSFWFGGLGFLVYLVLAISFPKEDAIATSRTAKLFGVCNRFSKRFDIDVGLVRAGFVFSLLLSGGTTLFVYVALYFFLPSSDELGAK
jgi:phage shock protein C